MIARSPLISRGCCCESRLYSVELSTRRELDEVVKMVDRGVLKPVIDNKMPLEEAAAAHRRVMIR